jgi:hypothetical protein
MADALEELVLQPIGQQRPFLEVLCSDLLCFLNSQNLDTVRSGAI